MSKISNTPKQVRLLLVMACVASTLIISCSNPKVVSIPVPDDSSALGKINHHINSALITQFRKAFESDSLRLKNPDLFITESEGFNKPALLELLKDPNCVGLRIYYGITTGNRKQKELRMIIVGTDSKGKDLLIGNSAVTTDITQAGDGLEYGQCCQGSSAQ